MAYIDTNQITEIRNKIKALFPSKNGWKFSITRENYSGVRIAILQAPVNFLTDSSKNGYTIRPDRQSHPYLQQIYSIANAGNFDNSDSMTDYFHVGWYVWLSIGQWDKEFKFVKN